MNEKLNEQLISGLIEKGIRRKVFPGAILSVKIDDKQMTVCRGNLSFSSSSKRVNDQTLYDLASLTKVVATLPMVLLSIQLGKISLNDPLNAYFPEWRFPECDPRLKDITVFHLLTHSSGLPAWRPYFLIAYGETDYIEQIAKEKLVYKPGSHTIYSDLGFMMLGFLLERLWDEDLDTLVTDKLFRPLKMRHTIFRPLQHPADRDNIAATEEGNRYEREMAVHYLAQRTDERAITENKTWLTRDTIERFNWRTEEIRGEVHDCNAYYGLNGVSGHAGLFSTISDLQSYMKNLWEDTGDDALIEKKLRRLAIQCYTPSMPLKRGLGFEKPSSDHRLYGSAMSEKAFGHTGFTGTSLLRDPESHVTTIVLSNRVNPSVSRIAAWRDECHHTIFTNLKRIR